MQAEVRLVLGVWMRPQPQVCCARRTEEREGKQAEVTAQGKPENSSLPFPSFQTQREGLALGKMPAPTPWEQSRSRLEAPGVLSSQAPSWMSHRLPGRP